MDDPKVLALARASERTLELAHDLDGSQRRHSSAHANRDVAWESRREGGTPTVEDDRVRPWLAPGSRTPPAPPMSVLQR